MEAAQEIVGGLGKWTPGQKVSEKLGYPARSCGRLFCLQKGHLFLACSQGGDSGTLRKWGPPGPLSQPLWTPKGLIATPIFPQIQPHWLTLRILTKEPGHLLRLA